MVRDTRELGNDGRLVLYIRDRDGYTPASTNVQQRRGRACPKNTAATRSGPVINADGQWTVLTLGLNRRPLNSGTYFSQNK